MNEMCFLREGRRQFDASSNIGAARSISSSAEERIGTGAARRANRFEALEPIAQGIAVGFKLRHDRGSQYVSDYFQAEIAFLSAEISPAFAREPEGGCAEHSTLRINALSYRIENLQHVPKPIAIHPIDLEHLNTAVEQIGMKRP